MVGVDLDGGETWNSMVTGDLRNLSDSRSIRNLWWPITISLGLVTWGDLLVKIPPPSTDRPTENHLPFSADPPVSPCLNLFKPRRETERGVMQTVKFFKCPSATIISSHMAETLIRSFQGQRARKSERSIDRCRLSSCLIKYLKLPTYLLVTQIKCMIISSSACLSVCLSSDDCFGHWIPWSLLNWPAEPRVIEIWDKDVRAGEWGGMIKCQEF